jgi:hypothetical protein
MRYLIKPLIWIIYFLTMIFLGMSALFGWIYDRHDQLMMAVVEREFGT